jgi:hypothetical protein
MFTFTQTKVLCLTWESNMHVLRGQTLDGVSSLSASVITNINTQISLCAWVISGHVLEKVNNSCKSIPSTHANTPFQRISWNTPKCFVTRKFLEGMQLRIRVQVETCSMYALNVNFEKLNFGPRKNDYRLQFQPLGELLYPNCRVPSVPSNMWFTRNVILELWTVILLT